MNAVPHLIQALKDESAVRFGSDRCVGYAENRERLDPHSFLGTSGFLALAAMIALGQIGVRLRWGDWSAVVQGGGACIAVSGEMCWVDWCSTRRFLVCRRKSEISRCDGFPAVAWDALIAPAAWAPWQICWR